VSTITEEITMLQTPAQAQRPCHIVITGGAGFLGVLLARSLLAAENLAFAGGDATAIAHITLVDRVLPPADLLVDARVRAVTGDLTDLLQDPASAGTVIPADTTLVFHLAAAVSGECEADFDLGMRSNLAATLALLERCRSLKTRPMLVFSSSLAVFGDAPGQPMPNTLDDNTLPTPQSSYGIQKFMGEQLVADYTRKGFVQGRSVRLMTVSVRPGKANGAASSFLSGMLREPLAGVRARCPVPPETPVALSSAACSIAGLICAAQTSDAAWGPRTALTLPALTTTPAEMAAALARVAGPQVAALIDWVPDPAIHNIVKTWPARIHAQRAQNLGLLPEASFDDIIRAYVQENPQSIHTP
jgi:nucleoside-diphosphate-sugar epimerase